MLKTTRVSISLPDELLKSFDEVVEKTGQRNRSAGIGAAMREYVTSNTWVNEEGNISGAVLVTFDHDSRGINDALTSVQHNYGDVISASMHLHLDARNCLEIIAVRGSAERVKRLARELSGKKGILNLKVVASGHDKGAGSHSHGGEWNHHEHPHTHDHESDNGTN